MSLMRHRAYLRRLSVAQRRSWVEQRRRLAPRVSISAGWVAPADARQFAYIDVGGAR